MLFLLACAPRLVDADVVGVIGPAPTEPPPPSPVPAMDLSALESLGSFAVRPTGDLVGPLSGRKCTWFSVTIGQAVVSDLDVAWSSSSRGPQSEEDLVFAFLGGVIVLPWRSVRPFTRPVWVRTYTEAPTEPEWLQERLAEAFDAGPVTVAEYCLVEGEEYAAVVHSDTFPLPPGQDGEMRHGLNRVLHVRQGDAPLVPAYQGWSY